MLQEKKGWRDQFGRARPSSCGYRIFTSSAYRTDTAKWRFSQEVATRHDVAMPTSEVKMLQAERRTGRWTEKIQIGLNGWASAEITGQICKYCLCHPELRL